MNCRHVVNLMSAYIDGELTGIEMLDIRAHLHDCPECRREYESLRLVKQTLAELKTVAPREEFASSILQQLDAVEVTGYQHFVNTVFSFLHKRMTPVATALAVSGAALVILSVGGVDNGQKNSNSAMIAAPFSSEIQNAEYIPEIDDSNISSISNNKPLVVAADAPEFKLTYASMSPK